MEHIFFLFEKIHVLYKYFLHLPAEMDQKASFFTLVTLIKN